MLVCADKGNYPSWSSYNEEYEIYHISETIAWKYTQKRTYDHPMTREECDLEKQQLDGIKGINVSKAGFICSSGFAFKDSKEFTLISGNDLYGN